MTDDTTSIPAVDWVTDKGTGPATPLVLPAAPRSWPSCACSAAKSTLTNTAMTNTNNVGTRLYNQDWAASATWTSAPPAVPKAAAIKGAQAACKGARVTCRGKQKVA